MFDIIIIGAGVAGISAGIYSSSRGKDVLIIEKNKIGGLIAKVSSVTHYVSALTNESGKEFAARLEKQVKDIGLNVIYEDVKEVDLIGEVKKVKTQNNIYEAKKIIIANGTSPRNLHIKNQEKLLNKGFCTNAATQAKEYENKNVYVIGGGDGAIKEALYLSNFAKKVTIINMEDNLICIDEFKKKIAKKDNIEVKNNIEIKAIYGENEIESIDFFNNKDNCVQNIEDKACGIFVYAGIVPNTQMYTQLELENGFIKTDDNMETTIKNVYAVGDIREKAIRQVSTSVCDGTIAGVRAGAGA